MPLTWTVLFAEASNRPAVSFAEAARAALHPASLLTVLFGDLFGAADPKVEYWGRSARTGRRAISPSHRTCRSFIAGALTGLAVTVIGVSRGLLGRPPFAGWWRRSCSRSSMRSVHIRRFSA